MMGGWIFAQDPPEMISFYSFPVEIKLRVNVETSKYEKFQMSDILFNVCGVFAL